MQPQLPQETTKQQPAPKTVDDKMGRPTVSENDLQKVIGLLQRGHTVEIACRIAGIAESTFYNYQKNDEKFLKEVTHAREYAKLLAGDIIFDVLLDATRNTPLLDKDGNPRTTKSGRPIYGFKYQEKNRIDTAWRFLEAQEAEAFGRKPLERLNPDSGNTNTQNNYFFLDDERARQIANTAEFRAISSGKIIDILEGRSVVDGGGEKESSVALDQTQPQSGNSSQSSVSQP